MNNETSLPFRCDGGGSDGGGSGGGGSGVGGSGAGGGGVDSGSVVVRVVVVAVHSVEETNAETLVVSTETCFGGRVFVNVFMYVCVYV